MGIIRPPCFRRGEIVEVRSEPEILSTLKSDGTLDGLPFMPEMREYCGSRFRVVRRAEKTCVEGCGMRRMRQSVFLEGVRCDGSFHEGCERRCLIFWKEAWLKPAEPAGVANGPVGPVSSSPKLELPSAKDKRFYCQSTALEGATDPLPWWDVRQYLRDLAVREVTLPELVVQLSLLAGNRLRRTFRGAAIAGPNLGQGDRQNAPLHLRPGELVQVKSLEDIVATLNAEGKNRGLEFTPDMAQYCGGRYRVAGRVEKIILECSGEMRQINDTVILEDLVCNGRHARGCPRANYHYWREAWLTRVYDRKDRSAPGTACPHDCQAVSALVEGGKP